MRNMRNREEHLACSLQTANGRRRMGTPKITCEAAGIVPPARGLARVGATKTRRRPASNSLSTSKRGLLARCGWSAPVTIVHLDCCPEKPGQFGSRLCGPSAPAFRACKPARSPRNKFLPSSRRSSHTTPDCPCVQYPVILLMILI